MKRIKLFIAAIALFTVFTVVGVLAVRSSSYMDIDDLVKLDRPAKVTVKGVLANLYYDPTTRTLYLYMKGKNGATVVALLDANYVEEKYGPIQYLRWDPNNIVVEGIYDPSTKTLRVLNILSGCHSSYSQPAAPRA